MNMVILSRIVKPKMFEPQKYRRKGRQSYFIHDKTKRKRRTYSVQPALEAPGEKKKHALSQNRSRNRYLAEFLACLVWKTSDSLLGSQILRWFALLHWNWAHQDTRSRLDWIELACGLWVCGVWLHHFRSYCRSIHVNLHDLHGRVPSVQTSEASFNEALPAARALWIGLAAGPSRDAVTGRRCGDDTRVFCGCFGDCRSKTFQNQWHVGDRGGTWGHMGVSGTPTVPPRPRFKDLAASLNQSYGHIPWWKRLEPPTDLQSTGSVRRQAARSQIFSDF